MWGVFRDIPCSRVCYALFESKKQAQSCADNFCKDNIYPNNDYYVVYAGVDLKSLAKYMVYGVKP